MRHMTSFVLLLLLAALASAEIPQVMSYQGKVTDTSGNPVADGSYTMRFRIYDAASAGSLLWDSGDCTVAVTGAIFSVLLGESPQPALGLDFSEDYWLAVTFSGVDQTPRQQLASIGYAYMASGLVPGTEVSGSVTSGTDAAIKGTNTATTGFAFGLSGWSNSNSGSGVWGYAGALSGSPNGVYGWSVSTAGNGVQGYVSASSGETRGVYGWSSSSAGRGVYGLADAPSGTTYGVYGSSASTSGRGIYGYATATTGTTYGVYGRSGSSAGMGVAGWAYAVTGSTYGVYGRCDSTTDGRGVYGYASATRGYTSGVDGESTSTAGRGVSGLADASTGITYGGRFESASTSGRGIYGYATATTGSTYGVYGRCDSNDGRGVYGYAIATTGTTYGVSGWNDSTSGRGVLGWATATTGTTYGVSGWNDSTAGAGVRGNAYATTGETYGVFGSSDSSSGYGVYYSGGLAGTGSKSCVVKTSQGPTLMYCQESPENWFEDFGEGRLENGRCHVELDPLFLETVTIDATNPMKVFLQPQDPECEGLAAILSESAFDAVELRHGTSSGRFTYRVVAKRKGFEAKRLDVCEAARTDSYLYPELREKELRELEEERAIGSRQ